MSASEEVLGSLHSELVQLLLAKIEAKTATAAELSVARGLLKDSEITCKRGAGSATGELEAAMAARREARRKRTEQVRGSAVPLDMDAALEQFDFMTGGSTQ